MDTACREARAGPGGPLLARVHPCGRRVSTYGQTHTEGEASLSPGEPVRCALPTPHPSCAGSCTYGLQSETRADQRLHVGDAGTTHPLGGLPHPDLLRAPRPQANTPLERAWGPGHCIMSRRMASEPGWQQGLEEGRRLGPQA